MGQAARIGESTDTARMALIDGLRALAAIAVLFYHYMHFAMTGVDRGRYVGYLAYQPFRPWLALLYDYGFYAVEIFWMISGFVFAAVYFARDASTREFAANRLARLYPLHLVTLLTVAGLQALALSRLGTTLLYDNFDLAHFTRQLVFASDWVEAGGHSFNGPIWSVSVEVTVYALFWILRDPLKRMGAGGLVAVIGLCLLANVFGTVSRIPTCAFYFFCGTALLRLHTWLGRREGLRAALLAGSAIVGTVCLAAGGAFVREVIALPFLAGAAILALAAIEHRAGTRLRAAAQWLGDCTYGIYLWHVPLQLALMLALLPAHNPATLAAQGWFLPLWIASVVGWARLSFIWIERPAREWLRHLARPRSRPGLAAST
jgi:peptidoglycan/LPS O-acetylase OafA/YrhL